jgi:hypothetical protein
MFRPIWSSLSVQIVILCKLLCFILQSYTASVSVHALVRLLVMGRSPCCVACVVLNASWLSSKFVDNWQFSTVVTLRTKEEFTTMEWLRRGRVNVVDDLRNVKTWMPSWEADSSAYPGKKGSELNFYPKCTPFMYMVWGMATFMKTYFKFWALSRGANTYYFD